MRNKKRILLKLTGKAFLDRQKKALTAETIKQLAQQIHKLKNTHQFGIVVGGGNILRGEELGAQIGLSPTCGHQAGMLATMINGLLLKDMLKQQGISASLLSAIVCPQISPYVSQRHIDEALEKHSVIIFSGGTGVPFFTTDTTAIIRGLQIGAQQIWKGTGIDGIYTADPKKDKNATMIKKVKYFDAIEKKLGILDLTALALAEKHKMPIRVFNIFEDNALIKASEDDSFGSIIN